MARETTGGGDPVTVEWRRAPAESVSRPVVGRRPYLELKLEHPALEATGRAERFFPDAVPYEHRGDHRVFYWRPALVPSPPPAEWGLACATTHALVGVDGLPWSEAPLTTADGDRTTVVVDGTVGGDAATTRVSSYAEPAVGVTAASETAVELTAAGSLERVAAGERRRIPLDEQRVDPCASGQRPTTVTPVLAVRYPGERELHHPARGATYRLFPSFGLDLDELSTSVAVPTTAGELDHRALATDLGVDLSARPYPERALWQAFAYAAFDPHAETTPEIAQFDSGHLVLLDGNFDPSPPGRE